MSEENNDNNFFHHESIDKKSNKPVQNKDLDEYDKYLKLELENFRKPTPKRFTNDKIEFISNNEEADGGNLRNFIMENEESNETNLNNFDQNINKSLKQNNTNNISNNESYSIGKATNNSVEDQKLTNKNEREIFYFDKNTFQDFKNIGDQNTKHSVLHNNFDNLNNLNKQNNIINTNTLISNNFLPRSENGNPNTNFLPNQNNNNETTSNNNNNFYNNQNSDKINMNKDQFENLRNLHNNININTDLNDYLTDKNSNYIENPNNCDNELIDDNEKYIFSNNLEYTNYNINTNSNQENLDVDNTQDIINNYNNRKNFDILGQNQKIGKKFLKNEVNEINSLDEDEETNYQLNQKNNKLKIDDITQSNSSNDNNNNYNNTYKINNNNNNKNFEDYNDAFLREGKVQNDVLFYNDKATEYESILNNCPNNVLGNSKNSHNQIYKDKNQMDDLKYSYETEINKKLEQKLKKAAVSFNNKSLGNHFGLDPKRPAYDKANYCTFTQNYIKTLSDQTANSELLPSKPLNRTHNLNIYEDLNNDKKSNYNIAENEKHNYLRNEGKDSLMDIQKEESIQFNRIGGLDFSREKPNNKREESEYYKEVSQISQSDNYRRANENIEYYAQNNNERKRWKILGNNDENDKEQNIGFNDNSEIKNDEYELNIYAKPTNKSSSVNQNLNISNGTNLLSKPIASSIHENNKNIKNIINKNIQKEINISNNLLNNTANIFNQIISNPEYENDQNSGFQTLQDNRKNKIIPEYQNNSEEDYNQNKYQEQINDNPNMNENQYTGIENFTRNDYKLKALKIKIEEKIREEYENKIIQKEKEISDKTKTDFEEAMYKLKNELEKNLEQEKNKLESDLAKKWQDKYENLKLECKSKLRNDKEKKLAETMYQKLKPVVEKEIYKKEYFKIEEKIRNEVEEKIKIEIQNKKNEELDKIKKKFEAITKSKIQEMENKVKNNCKEQFDSEMKKEMERKEKEIKINYLNKFEGFKASLENQLKEEYECKKKELNKEMSEMRAKMYSQKCAENLKMQKINKIKDNLHKTEINTLQKAEKLEKIISKKSKEKSFSNKKNKASGVAPKKHLEESHNDSKVLGSSFIQKKLNHSKNHFTDNDDDNYQNNKNDNSYNNPQNSNYNQFKPNNDTSIKFKKKYLSLNIDENSENNIKIFNNMNINSPTSAIDQIMSNYNVSGYIKEDNPLTNNASFIVTNQNTRNENILSHHKMNAVNLFELNRRIKGASVNNNTSKKENSIFLKEAPSYIPQEQKPTKTLAENLNEIIEKGSKLISPIIEENQPQIIYKKFSNNDKEQNNTSHIISPKNQDINKINKNISNLNYNLNNSSNIILSEIQKQESTIKPTAASPKQINITSNQETLNNNINNNLSFMKSVYNINNSAQINNLSTKNNECNSLTLEKNIPLSLNEFGKFLIKYIEKEENYRLLFEKEIKKIKDKIKKIFEKNNQSDHCLLDYILELWDKLEVSFSVRYKILMDLCKKNNSTEIYNFLDVETEFITDYFKNSQNIFTQIKNREKIKNRLQIKSNRNELSFEDKQKFKNLTNDIEKNIKSFKDKNKISIVWRGLEYEWVK